MAVLVSLAASVAPLRAQVSPQEAPDTLVAPKRFWLTTAEILGLNTAIWVYDRYIREGGGAGFRIGTQSWAENIKNGFEWDDNNFSTNMFAHPYHGNLYYNAARSNNYDFWESVPFTFAGSFTWEYFFETHHPSFNDWVMTSVGGIALGEATYRLSSMILDNTATGSERVWREIGATAVAPTRGLTRLLTGEAFRLGPNPADQMPTSWGSQLRFGLRRTGVEDLWNLDTTRVFLRARFRYGDPFEPVTNEPFESFTFDGSLTFGEAAGLGEVFGEGILGSGLLRQTETAQHRLASTLQFSYINTFAYQFGGASTTGSLLSRIELPKDATFSSDLALALYFLAGVKSHYPDFTGRSYDFGPGLGLNFSATIHRRGWDVLGFALRQAWIHSANGNDVDHHLTYTSLRAQVPLRDFFGLGAEYQLYLAEAEYATLEDVSSRHPELRLYLIWNN